MQRKKCISLDDLISGQVKVVINFTLCQVSVVLDDYTTEHNAQTGKDIDEVNSIKR